MKTQLKTFLLNENYTVESTKTITHTLLMENLKQKLMLEKWKDLMKIKSFTYLKVSNLIFIRTI